ncbi:MAG TPA: PQQ-dependent sugar dehydrogenase [Thermoleophilaceae bacterium]|nr:PQQ-dependent sugar dehydrogenase [Thermoleophilaceae bacterium]
MRAGTRLRRLALAFATAATLIAAAPAQATFHLAPAFTGSVSQPMYVTSPPGDSHRLFIVTRPGLIRVAVDGVLQSTPFLDIHTRVWTTGEAGLISMAFDPGYENPASPGYGLFYVYFVQVPGAGESNGAIHIEEFKTDPATSPNVANQAGRPVLVIPHNDASNHYGGTLRFNPNDGLLYIGTGDGGGSDNQFGNAQDTKKSLLGKLLRIDPHMSGSNPYSIPAGNPFQGQPRCNPPPGTTNCPEILAWGLRNPFRWSFDRATGDIAIGDVGQGQWEEVDYVPAGATLAGDNFGWPCFEGPVAYKSCTANPRVDPVLAYSHTGLSGSVAITGGLVVRDPGLGPLIGRYLYADFYAGVIHSLQLATPSATGDRVETDFPTVGSLVSFGEDADGHVYVVSLNGDVQRITCDSACPPPSTGAGGGGGPPAPAPTQPTSTPSAKDVTAPHLRLRGARLQDVLRRGVVRLSINCDERCVVRATGKARNHALRGVLRHFAAGKRSVLELHVSKRVRRALTRSGVIRISVRGRDAAGNLRKASLTVRVKRG